MKLHYRKLERLVRGFSNHRRIQMLALIKENPDCSVVEVSEKLHINFKTASEHIIRLANAGLITKRSVAASVIHRLTRRGKIVLEFLRTLE